MSRSAQGPGWMGDYVDVETRIGRFYEQYPEGSIQVEVELFDPETGTALLRARAFRSPDDEKPCIGIAMEARDHSPTEIMREGFVEAAGTHAIGKALEAAGFRKKVEGNDGAGKREGRSREKTSKPPDAKTEAALRNRILDLWATFDEADLQEAFRSIAPEGPEKIPAGDLVATLNDLLKQARELGL